MVDQPDNTLQGLKFAYTGKHPKFSASKAYAFFTKLWQCLVVMHAAIATWKKTSTNEKDQFNSFSLH
jgi:hypothetical protein